MEAQLAFKTPYPSKIQDGGQSQNKKTDMSFRFSEKTDSFSCYSGIL
jgi:hypothetical protein